jgi:hypothetical protein
VIETTKVNGKENWRVCVWPRRKLRKEYFIRNREKKKIGIFNTSPCKKQLVKIENVGF